MKLKQIWVDTQGASMVEFALVVPAFCMVIFGFLAAGLLVWTYFGLEHSVQVAARCGAINYPLVSNNNANPNCNSTTTVASYALAQYWGLNPLPQFSATIPPSTCTTSTTCCGYLVKVSPSYNFTLISDVFPHASIQLTAQSCYPAQ